MTTVLVTGAEGFIGSHVTDRLVRDGFQVRATCLYNSFGSLGWLSDLDDEVREGLDIRLTDIRDPRAAQRIAMGCDAVIHMAALIGIPYSYQSPASYVETNVAGTLNLLQAALDAGVDQFIHTSTSEVYGSAQFVPMTEEHPLHAQSPYAASKIAADQLALSYHRSFGLNVKVMRPFNAYGPRQSERAVIPAIIGQLMRGDGRLRLGALEPTRDFTFVSDTAAAFACGLQADGISGEVINVGSGFEISIGELVALIASEFGTDPIICGAEEERLRPQASEVQRLFASHTKAQRLLGWKPQFAGLEGLREGIRTTIDWFRGTPSSAHSGLKFQV